MINLNVKMSLIKKPLYVYKGFFKNKNIENIIQEFQYHLQVVPSLNA
jgi:hypothetical protein